MESLGNQVYRLCGQIIEKYVVMFRESEIFWITEVQKYAFFPCDYVFVSTLPTHQLRVFFWLDKINLFSEQQLILALTQMQSSYIINNFWRLPPYIFTREESELFYLLHLYFSDEKFCPNVPILARCILDFYSVIGF